MTHEGRASPAPAPSGRSISMRCRRSTASRSCRVVGRQLAPTQEVAKKYGIAHATTDLGEALAQPGVDAVILCTPTQMHAAQAISA